MGSAVSHSNCHYVPLLNLPIGSVLFRRTAANARVLWAGPVGRSSHIVSECTARSEATSGKYQAASCRPGSETLRSPHRLYARQLGPCHLKTALGVGATGLEPVTSRM